jgi:hypothetical protein
MMMMELIAVFFVWQVARARLAYVHVEERSAVIFIMASRD